VLGEVAGSHLFEGGKHGLEGAEVLLLNHLFEESGIVPGKLGMVGRYLIDM